MMTVRPIYLRIIDRTGVEQANRDDARKAAQADGDGDGDGDANEDAGTSPRTRTRGLQIAAQRADRQSVMDSVISYLFCLSVALFVIAFWVFAGFYVARLVR